MQFEFSTAREAAEANAVRCHIEAEADLLAFRDMKVRSISIRCRFVLDGFDQMDGYRLEGVDERRALQIVGYPSLKADHRAVEDDEERPVFQQKWLMAGTMVSTDRSLPRKSQSLFHLYDCCRRIVQFQTAVLPAFGKTPGSIEIAWQGVWKREEPAAPLRLHFLSKAITVEGRLTCGLPASAKKVHEAEAWQP